MQLQKLISILLMANSVWMLVTISATAGEVRDTSNRKIRQLSEIERPITNAQMLVQASTLPNGSTFKDASEVVQVTGVKVNPTAQGVEVILETSAEQQLRVLSSSYDRTYVANILNARLALPEERTFRTDNPVAGITTVTVTQLAADSVRVTVIGTTGVPSSNIVQRDSALVLGLTAPITPTAQQPTPPPNVPQTVKPESEIKPETTPQTDNVTPEGVQQPPATAEGDEEQEIVVTGDREGYSVPDASTATRTDTPLRDIPQSIQVVPRQVIEDQQITRISDAVRNVSGVTVQREYGDYSDAYNIRGFTTYDTLRNGFKGYSTIVPSNNIERVEVFKGPASVLYGQFEPGGVVNYITKQPLSEPYYAAEFTAGSYDYYSPSIDLSGSLTGDEKLLYRLNTAYTSSGSFVDFVERDVFSISPTLTYRFSDATTLSLSYDYIRSDGVHYDGFAPDPGFFEAPINRFTGEPDGNEDETQRHNINLTFSHRFNDNLEFRSNFAVLIDRLNNSIFRPRGLEDDGRTIIRSYERNLFNDTDIYSLQNNLIAKFNTGAIEHQLLLGFDWLKENQDNVNLSLEDGEVASLDLFDPVYGTPIPTQLNGIDAADRRRTETYAIYLQDQVTLLSNLKLLIGGRYDFVDNRTITQSYRGENIISTDDVTDNSFYDEAFSPRIGIVYQPIEPISLYASYSRSFVPNNDRTASGTPIEPSRGTQYEVGIKAELTNNLSATLAAYEITKTNVPTTDPENPDFSIATGEVKSRGIEFDIGGEISPGWNIIASTFVNDAYVSEDNNPAQEGDTLVNAPKQGASLWTTYEIQSGNLQGLGFGAGLFFAGDREAELPNTFELPSYVRADASIFYKRDNWRIGLNFKNLFDKKYYESQGYWIRPGTPFTVLGTISVQF